MAPLIALTLSLFSQDPTELIAIPVEKGPQIDGTSADACWKAAPEATLALWKPHDPTEKKTVRIRACHTANEIFFLLVWSDPSKEVRHRPFVWNKEKDSYEELELVEDTAALAFELEGPFDADMLAGKESKWDVWQWKAARTNPSGYAMDKWHQYSRSNLGGKSHKFVANDGQPVWILRSEDAGRSATSRRDRPEKYEGDEVAQFAAQTPDGSAGDIRAQGAWTDKAWTLELERKLNTGHKDDTTFEPSKSYGMSLAVFDKEEHGDHSVAATLRLTVK